MKKKKKKIVLLFLRKDHIVMPRRRTRPVPANRYNRYIKRRFRPRTVGWIYGWRIVFTLGRAFRSKQRVRGTSDSTGKQFLLAPHIYARTTTCARVCTTSHGVYLYDATRRPRRPRKRIRLYRGENYTFRGNGSAERRDVDLTG